MRSQDRYALRLTRAGVEAMRQRVGDGALGDREAEELAGQSRQPLEADMMAVVQIGQQGRSIVAVRRARRHVSQCAARKRLAQAQRPPCNSIRVTCGATGGTSMWS